jgi:uncharacterized membrane protein YbhN (UPF0104 family)
MLRRLVRWSQPAFLILALIAIGWFLVSQWPALRTYPWRLHWGWLLAASLINLASWGVEIAIWQHLLAALGGPLPYWATARIWFLSAIVRYVPGSVWQPLSLTLYARRHGVSPEATITSLVLFQVVMLLATVPILVVYFVWIDTKSLAAQLVGHLPPALLWAALIPVLAFLLRPQWLVQLLNWGLARVQRPPLALKLTSGMLLTLTLVALFDWLLWGGVFAAFTFGVAGAGVGNRVSDLAGLAPLLITSYSLANVIGFLSVIAPGGFGVREGAFYLLLTPHIAGSVVTVIALGIRVWGVVSELLLALISAPFEKASTTLSVTPSITGAPQEALPLDLALPEPVVAPDLPHETLREPM